MDSGTLSLGDYQAFLERKAAIATRIGFDVDESEINPILKPHCKDAVRWAIRGGRRAIFAAYGLHKTVIQLEIQRILLNKTGCELSLTTTPLGVRQEFFKDAQLLRTGEHEEITDNQRDELRSWLKGDSGRLCPNIEFVQKSKELTRVESGSICLTNYESLREEKLDLKSFGIITLDEGDCLRSFGSKTFGEFVFGSIQTIEHRFVATATPSPNEYQELIAYAHFLGVMDIGQSRTRFFKRNSEKSDDLTLHAHKEQEFWLWVSSWALFLQKPSDLGYSDEGYELPPLDVRFHKVSVDHRTARPDKFGQGRLYRQSSAGVSEAAKEKRDSLNFRIAKMQELITESPEDHFILWHDLEDERRAIEKAVPGVVSVFGSQKLDLREKHILGFRDGEIKYLAGKPQMLGSGPNFQKHCHREIFVGIGHKFKEFIQAIHRVHRFLQKHQVRIDVIFAESEQSVLDNLLEKWERDKEQRRVMAEIIRKYGLSHEALNSKVTRTLGVEREERSGEMFRAIYNDAVLECRDWESNSVGMVLTSIPFSTQYEYTPSYNDFGHTDDNEHFFEQMDFLTPELLRVLKPGRIAAVHVKDRIVPSGMTGLGFQVVYDFHNDVTQHFKRHGFHFMGMNIVITDVVKENLQTYRLGHTEQCKDGSKMGVGLPEFVLLFRKAPTENQNSYADEPVVKPKEDYHLARWQLDAHSFWRSNGNRLFTPEEIKSLPLGLIMKRFKDHSLNSIYDFEKHVELGKELSKAKRLRTDWMVIPPQSWHEDVWTDVTRIRTLNTVQAQKNRVKHLCPLQFDVVDRLVSKHSMPGELVLDPFAGLMTVPYRSILLGRRGVGIELNHDYWRDGITYCESAEQKKQSPALLDLFEFEEELD